ncbi:MAG TPA: hypothetical protein VFF64_18720, partial [Candidatus Eremiobacteraceae bacterium]|nr:hypothetical protein [Candidatus Eremiobacteraceae bacterium]
SGRSRTGSSERRLGEDFVSGSRGVRTASAQAFATPALRKVREGRGTLCFGMGRENNKYKPGPPVPK